MGKRNVSPTNMFPESAELNAQTYNYYLNRLTELAVSRFNYKNLPDSVDQRYIELGLFLNGSMIYFKDEVIGDLCLNCLYNGAFDVYGNPVSRRAYSSYNNYQKVLDAKNSVIIYNNYMRTNSVTQMQFFARKLYLIDRVIDVNINAQKTPVLVQCSEQQRLTLLNLYMKYDGNEPFIFGDKNLDLQGLKALSTGAPYVSDKLYTLKVDTWNEALTCLGISNVAIQKKERMVTDEVNRSQGGTIASRYTFLQARKDAVEKINEMFDQNIEVEFAEDIIPTSEPGDGCESITSVKVGGESDE